MSPINAITTTNYQQQTTNNQQPTTNNQQPTTNNQQPTTNNKMTRKYNVFGLGNALLDMEFEISLELLEQLKLDKGVMTLVDEDRQATIIQQLKGQPCEKSCGGSAANTMVALSQLGGKGFYSCKVAGDEIGAYYLEDLENCGLDTNIAKNNRPEGITGKCLVLVTPDADRTMSTFLGISADFSPEELATSAILDSEYVYIEGYLVSSPPAKAAAIKAKEIADKGEVKTAVSLSDPNTVQYFKPGILEIIGSGVDLIFANRSEALTMAETQDLAVAMDYLKTISKTFAITRGGEGSLVFDGEKLIEIAPFPVKAIDTLGAGDMYAGAFLYGITKGMSWEKAGNLASLASSRIVTRFGPRLETEELKSFIAVDS